MLMELIRRAKCRPRTASTYGSTLDVDGNACVSLSDDDKTALAAGMAVCGVILLGVIGAWASKYLRAHYKRQRMIDENTLYKAPLMASASDGWSSASAFTSRPTSGVRTPSPESPHSIRSPSVAASHRPESVRSVSGRSIRSGGVRSRAGSVASLAPMRQVVSSSPNTKALSAVSVGVGSVGTPGFSSPGRQLPPAPIMTGHPSPNLPQFQSHLPPSLALASSPAATRSFLPASPAASCPPPIPLSPTGVRPLVPPSPARSVFASPPPPSPTGPRPPRGSSLPTASLPPGAAPPSRSSTNESYSSNLPSLSSPLVSPPLVSPGMPLTPTTPTMLNAFFSEPTQFDDAPSALPYDSASTAPLKLSPKPGPHRQASLPSPLGGSFPASNPGTQAPLHQDSLSPTSSPRPMFSQPWGKSDLPSIATSNLSMGTYRSASPARSNSNDSRFPGGYVETQRYSPVPGFRQGAQGLEPELKPRVARLMSDDVFGSFPSREGESTV